MTLTDEQKTAAHAAYADALARSDDGIGTREQQAADRQVIDRFEASGLAYEYEDWEIAQWNAEQAARTCAVEITGNEDDGYWWACACAEDGAYDTKADAQAAADAHDHLDERSDP